MRWEVTVSDRRVTNGREKIGSIKDAEENTERKEKK